MSLLMPKPEDAILSNRNALAAALRRILPSENIIDQETELRAYECDAFTMYRQLPLIVVLPETVEQVSRIMALAAEMNVKVVPRGAGTSLSGGSMPLADGILLGLGKFNSILEVDFPNRCVRVQPGVTNLAITTCRPGRRLLLRARPVITDRLFHWRQCRGEFRRRALSEIRADDQQHSWSRNRIDGRRGGAARRQASRFRVLRSHGPDDGVRGFARRHHRSHGPYPEEAAMRPRHPYRISERRSRRRLRGCDHRPRHHTGRARNDGPHGHSRRRGLLSLRISARCGIAHHL